MSTSFTYEVNLLCGVNGCNEMLCSRPEETAAEAEKTVWEEALHLGWTAVSNKDGVFKAQCDAHAHGVHLYFAL